MGREYLSTTDELKKQLRALQTKKSNIEKELLAFVEALPPNAGMDAPLVDREGFPRSDVDVTLVRQLRQKIISEPSFSFPQLNACTDAIQT
ncbi:MAG: hypothetical protein EOO38_30495 [Cytophagaceae bacterium]|nr:MAG: hypothetical protein EOO38_30495 [Cytophagaceae bacterium]